MRLRSLTRRECRVVRRGGMGFSFFSKKHYNNTGGKSPSFSSSVILLISFVSRWVALWKKCLGLLSPMSSLLPSAVSLSNPLLQVCVDARPPHAMNSNPRPLMVSSPFLFLQALGFYANSLWVIAAIPFCLSYLRGPLAIIFMLNGCELRRNCRSRGHSCLVSLDVCCISFLLNGAVMS